MAKPELGQKRICVSCSTRFYDLTKSPAVCPKCGTEQPIEQPRPRRGGNVTELRKPKKPAVIEDADTDVEVEVADDATLGQQRHALPTGSERRRDDGLKRSNG